MTNAASTLSQRLPSPRELGGWKLAANPIALLFWLYLRRLFGALDMMLADFAAGRLDLPEPPAPRPRHRSPARRPRAPRQAQSRQAQPRQAEPCQAEPRPAQPRREIPALAPRPPAPPRRRADKTRHHIRDGPPRRCPSP